MKRLFYNVLIVIFIFIILGFGIIVAEKIFPGEIYIIKHCLFNYENKMLSKIEKEELLLMKTDLSHLTSAEFNDSLMLINNGFKLSAEYEPVLIDLSGEVYLNPLAAKAYKEIKANVKENFKSNLYIMSAYRTAEEQAELTKSNEYAAEKGASEHLTGLAVDVYIPYHAGMGFIDTEEGQFVNEHCYNYGFIIRYPAYGESITEIPYEPWHLRYVGLPHAEIISKEKITLEEYILSLDIGEFYFYENYIISRQKESDVIEIPKGLTEIVISPDNTGCVIITGKQ